MRVMARITVPVEAGNKAMQEDRIGPAMQRIVERWKPEALYCVLFEGKRGMYMVFDLPDASGASEFCEPLFRELNAEVDIAPAMTAEDLQKGLSAFG